MSAPPTELTALLDLAEVDADVARLESRMRALEAQRAESEAMAAVDQAARRQEEAARAVDLAQRSQIRLEGVLADLQEKVRRAEDRVSQLSDTQQIEAAQREAAALRDQRSAAEDELLGAMETAESSQAEADDAVAAERTARERADTTNRELVTDLAEVEDELAGARQRRDEIADEIAPALLDQYEALRRKGVRPPVARFEGGRCQGCHLTLPATEVDQLRTLPADAVVFCSECGCLLVRSPRPDRSEDAPEI